MSRRTQRALERELFGPGPRAERAPRRKAGRALTLPPTYLPGACGACGDVCELAYSSDTWTCDACGRVYAYGNPRGAL